MQALDTTKETTIRKRPLPSSDATQLLRWRLRRVVKMTLWLLLSLTIALLSLEFVLRLVQFGEQEYLQIDPLLGLTHLENKLVTWRAEGFSHEKTNSDGFFESEHALLKPPGVIRIAVLGDSFTEALQVPLAQRFTSQLEAKLNHNNANKFQVLNFGVSGFGTGQEYLLYIEKVGAYQPDLVVACLNEWEPDKNTVWPQRPIFSLTEDGHLQISWTDFDNWRSSSSALPFTIFEWARRNSRVWGVLLQTYSDLKADPTYKKVSIRCCSFVEACARVLSASPFCSQTQSRYSWNPNKESKIKAKRLLLCKRAGLSFEGTAIEHDQTQTRFISDIDTSSNTAPQTVEKRWQITHAIVKQLAAACLHDRCKLALAVLPVRCQKESDKERFDWLASLDHSRQLPLLNMVPVYLRQQAKESDQPFLEGHLSTKGHELAASLLFDFLKRNHLLVSEETVQNSQNTN